MLLAVLAAMEEVALEARYSHHPLDAKVAHLIRAAVAAAAVMMS